MSDISITRFQPASVTREKVNAVEPAENDSGGLGSGGGQHSDSDHKRDAERKPMPVDRVTAPEGDELEDAVARLNAYVQRVQRDIVFDLEDEDNPSVTVFDRQSRQVLRQIDGEEARRLARQADDDEDLTLFDTRV